MPKRPFLLNSLARKRIRASWNKYNLYNFITWRKAVRQGTLFQQTFSAKQESRAYHGEHLTETQFRNAFRGELNGVNPLRAGSKNKKARSNANLPWALQTYVALERRLDTALFRCMFASSVRQASQFIKRGAVKVNGIKIKHANFALKAGDVLAVEPEFVLTALGRQKPSVQESVELVNRQIRRYNKYLAQCRKRPEVMFSLRSRHRSRHPAYAARFNAKQAERNEEFNKRIKKEMSSEIDKIKPKLVLENILKNEEYFDQNGTLPFEVALGKSLSVLEMVTGKNIDMEDAIKKGRKMFEEKNEEDEETEDENEISEMAEATEDAAEVAKTEAEDVAKDVTKTEAVNESTEDIKEIEEEVEPANETVEAEQEAQSEEKVHTSDSEQATASKTTEVDGQGQSSATQSTSSAAQPLSENIKNMVDRYFTKQEEGGPGNKSDVKRILSDIVKEQQEFLRKSYTSQLRTAESEETYDPTWLERLGNPVELVDAEKAKEDINSVLPIELPFSTGKLYGLADPSKGYFTPWTPRQFLAPFAILPHHLEISFKTCHAVYLRDPVARPGHSELISPFPLDMHEQAYMYYDARKRKR